jgi:hypothetical protein
MHGSLTGTRRSVRLFGAAAVTAALAAVVCAGAATKSSAATASRGTSQNPVFTWDAPHDVSPPLRDLAAGRVPGDAEDPADEEEGGPIAQGDANQADGALQTVMPPTTIPSTQANFEGLSNQDNFNIFGFRVNPPDPNGEVGPNNYVEMINLVFGVYDKSGNLLLGPVDTGTLWRSRVHDQ